MGLSLPLKSIERGSDDLIFEFDTDDFETCDDLDNRTEESSVDLAEIFKFVIGVWNDGVGAWLPTSRTDLPMMIGVLECLDQSESFIDGPSDGKVVHRDLP